MHEFRRASLLIIFIVISRMISSRMVMTNVPWVSVYVVDLSSDKLSDAVHNMLCLCEAALCRLSGVRNKRTSEALCQYVEPLYYDLWYNQNQCIFCESEHFYLCSSVFVIRPIILCRNQLYCVKNVLSISSLDILRNLRCF